MDRVFTFFALLALLFGIQLSQCFGQGTPDSTTTRGATRGLMTIDQLIKDSRADVGFIGNKELIARINANPKLVLIDVRTKEEYDAAHMKGATWLERGIAEFTLSRTLRDADAEIVVYCLKGNRSALVAKKLEQMGYRNVKSHVGLESWIADGYSLFNYMGEIKIVSLRKLNAATNTVEYYLDKKIGN